MLRRVDPVLMLHDSCTDNFSCAAENAFRILGLNFFLVLNDLIYAIGRDHAQMTIRL
jgi:hypothetical protein